MPALEAMRHFAKAKRHAPTLHGADVTGRLSRHMSVKQKPYTDWSPPDARSARLTQIHPVFSS